MQVQLTTTTKRENSTYIPTFNTTLQCRLKAPSSVMNPTLMFDRENVGNNYNYAYIPEFDRYYFVTNIVYAGALVEYDLRCDVLASFKATIGASSQYVLRSASLYDDTIVDKLYPLTTKVTDYSDTKGFIFASNGEADDGMYSVGVTANGGIVYYLLDQSGFNKFFARLLSDDYVDRTLDDLLITLPEMKLAVDPLQYIASVNWLPFRYFTGTEITSIPVGFVNIDVTPDTGMETPRVIEYPIHHVTDGNGNDFKFSFKDHPQAATRGAYLNSAPYTEMTFSCPPYGMVDLDPTVISNYDGVAVRIYVDLRTGESMCTLYAYTDNGYDLMLNRLYGSVAVPQALTQIVRQGEMSPLTLVGTALSAATGDPLSMISGAASAIGDAAAAKIPHTRQRGTTHSYLSVYGDLGLEYTYYYIVDGDNAQHGRPLCKQVLISGLSGYIMCAPGTEVQISGTADEQRQINDYMTGGFYYE